MANGEGVHIKMRVAQKEVWYNNLVNSYPEEINFKMNKQMVINIISGMFNELERKEHCHPTRFKISKYLAYRIKMNDNAYFKGVPIEIMEQISIIVSYVRMEIDD